MAKIILHILKLCLGPRADIELLKFVVALLIFVLNLSHSVSAESWDTEWAEPECLAAHTSCEYRLCIQYFVCVKL